MCCNTRKIKGEVMASIGFRCPEEIAAQIQSRQEITGKSKSEVIIELITGLPSVGINDRKDLPTDEVVYFVWTAKKLLYIGQTNNLKQKLYNHHRLVEFLNDESRVSWFNAAQCDRLEVESELIELFNPSLNGEPCLNERLATFRIPHGKLVAFQEICSSNGMNLSSVLNKIVDGVISAGGFSWEPKPSPDKFITQENLVAAITPLVARIEALEKGSGIVQIVDPPSGTGKYKPPFDSPFEKKDEPDIYTSEDGEPIPDPTPPVNESPKSCFDLVGTVSEVVEVPAQNEQILESPGESPDISESTPLEVPDTISEPTEFSQKTIDEVLNARPPVPDEIIYDHEGVDVTDPEMKRFFAGQLTHWTTVADALGFPRQHFESASASEKFQKEVETVICLDENLYLWIGEKINPVEETDD
jgi:hypothetical protein